MTTSPWSFASATELSDALAQKKISAIELAEHAIARIEHHDGKINAVCVRDFERALETARAADVARGRGENEAVARHSHDGEGIQQRRGIADDLGHPAQKDYHPKEDALAITRIKDAGGVILGKTNVPLGLGDRQSYNEIYGTTNNPYDLTRTPGGSSGGSAAALAAGYGPLSLGSDIAGSLRVPAFYCGIFAHKPTLALVPTRGHLPPPLPPLPLERDLIVIGPMARSAADLSLLLDVIAGPDPLEAGKASHLSLPPARHPALKDFRVLVIDSDPLMPTDTVVRAAIDELANVLEKAGADVARKSPLCRTLPRPPVFSCDCCCPSFRSDSPRSYTDATAAAANLPATDISLQAERLRSIALSHRDWLLADGAHARLRAQWRPHFRELRVVICPIMPTPAFAQDHSSTPEKRRINIDGKDYPSADQLAWQGIANLTGLPATAIPLGRSPEGLPVGVQIIGPWLEDRTPLKLAELIEREFGGFVPPPAFDA